MPPTPSPPARKRRTRRCSCTKGAYSPPNKKGWKKDAVQVRGRSPLETVLTRPSRQTRPAETDAPKPPEAKHVSALFGIFAENADFSSHKALNGGRSAGLVYRQKRAKELYAGSLARILFGRAQRSIFYDDILASGGLGALPPKTPQPL